MRIFPLDDVSAYKAELDWLKNDCAVIAAKLVANSVSPTTAPTAVGYTMADRSQWIVYHNALLAQLKTASLSYPN